METADSTPAETAAPDGCPTIGVPPSPFTLLGQLDKASTGSFEVASTCDDGPDLTLSAITLQDDSGQLSLSADTLPIVLAPGGTTTVSLSFTAHDYGMVEGTVTILSDAVDADTVTVDISAAISPDQDGDGHPARAAGGDDCDDTDPTVHAGAEEVWYDGIDENCDGADDYDQDGDGIKGDEHGLDCDDTDPTVGLASDEIWYDGIDEDCDGADDYDQDGDGYESADYGGDDCDDLDAAFNPGVDEIWYDGIDQNCDGADDYDQDGDGYEGLDYGGEDCDDADASAWPDAPEEEDLIDDDCDGYVDEDFVAEGDVLVSELMVNPEAVSDTVGEYIELYNAADYDRDLYLWTLTDIDGVSFTIDTHLVLAAGAYAVLGASDDSAVNGGVDVDYGYAGAIKLKNGADDTVTLALGDLVVSEVAYDTSWSLPVGAAIGLDPYSLDLDGEALPDDWCAQEEALPSGDLGTPGEENDLCPGFDHDDDGYTGEDGDCDDADPAVYPGADEVWYDGIDADCSGGSDYDQDGDGYEAASAGGEDCDDTDADISPAAEEVWYDGIDEDCSGGSDDDQDGDGYDAASAGGEDCDDTDADINPGAEEVWDGADSNCDGVGDDVVVSDASSLYLDGAASAEVGYPQGLGVGDLDDDGIDDLVVASAAYNSAKGGAWVLSGEDATTWAGDLSDLAWKKPAGSVAGARLGSVGPRLGDLDGDGAADLALAGTDIYSGAAVCIWLNSHLSSSCADAWATLYGAEDDEIRVRSDLDLDGTGVADLVFGDAQYGSTDRGRLYTVLDDALSSGALSMSTAYTARIRGGADGDVLASSLGGGDVDGDGVDDLLIGAPGAGTDSTGAVYLYLGGSTLTGAKDAPTGAALTVKGTSGTDLVGQGAPALGDLDGDGQVDLVVGAPGAGEVAVYYGAADLSGTLKISAADLLISGGDAADFGLSVSVADVTGDGVDDLLVGAPDGLSSSGGSGPGEAYVFQVGAGASMDSGDALARLEGEVDGDAFGGSVLAGMDIDGDGQGDLLIAAWGQDEGGSAAGRVYPVVMP